MALTKDDIEIGNWVKDIHSGMDYYIDDVYSVDDDRAVVDVTARDHRNIPKRFPLKFKHYDLVEPSPKPNSFQPGDRVCVTKDGSWKGRKGTIVALLNVIGEHSSIHFDGESNVMSIQHSSIEHLPSEEEPPVIEVESGEMTMDVRGLKPGEHVLVHGATLEKHNGVGKLVKNSQKDEEYTVRCANGDTLVFTHGQVSAVAQRPDVKFKGHVRSTLNGKAHVMTTSDGKYHVLAPEGDLFRHIGTYDDSGKALAFVSGMNTALEAGDD